MLLLDFNEVIVFIFKSRIGVRSEIWFEYKIGQVYGPI